MEKIINLIESKETITDAILIRSFNEDYLYTTARKLIKIYLDILKKYNIEIFLKNDLLIKINKFSVNLFNDDDIRRIIENDIAIIEYLDEEKIFVVKNIIERNKSKIGVEIIVDNGGYYFNLKVLVKYGIKHGMVYLPIKFDVMFENDKTCKMKNIIDNFEIMEKKYIGANFRLYTNTIYGLI